MTRLSGPVAPLVLAVVLASLASCTDDDGSPSRSEPPVPAPPARGEAWKRIDVGGTVRSLTGYFTAPVLAAGVKDDGSPLLVGIDGDIRDETLHQPEDRFGGSGLLAATDNGEAMSAVSAHDPTSGKPAQYWLGADYMDSFWDTPTDRAGNAPVWLAPLMDGEADVRLVGVTHEDEVWRVHAWEVFEDWAELLDNQPQLYVDGPPDGTNLHAGNTEAAVLLAGDLSPKPGGRFTPSAWVAGDRTDPSRWQRLPLHPAPDGITDIADWDVGWWIAGHRGLRPIVYGFDSRVPGATLSVPAVDLDPASPTVLVAALPISDPEPLILAVQSATGPSLWVEDGDDWQEFPAPVGHLEAAATSGRSAYLVIDGAVWWQELPEDLVPAQE